MASRTFQRRRWPAEMRPPAPSKVAPLNCASGSPCTGPVHCRSSAASWSWSSLAMPSTASSLVRATPALST
eukprot:1163995-Pyramimonas_sp.AAC.1